MPVPRHQEKSNRMTKEEILKEEYSKLIMNPEKVYAQNPSIIQAAHTAMDVYSKLAIKFVMESTYGRTVDQLDITFNEFLQSL